MIKTRAESVAVKSELKLKNTTACFVGNDSSGVRFKQSVTPDELLLTKYTVVFLNKF